MLAANVLCIKRKKKKRSYCVANLPDTLTLKHDTDKRPKSSSMLHITEDTPADMLSGAMDLTIHLPSGKAAKMCVERSTPMMDLLVQLTTNHQLQITNYTLQPLQSAPDASYPEKILSYYPNTPIGALDTQHVRVVPKTRTLPVPKSVPAGHQPFESTFRMKVHLPRNQLYVTRVSRHVLIEDIMRKVCEEKNLDPNKYEVRHPGNLDEVLDPKLTLNDYMITEIYLILKGSNSLTQTFSSNDIMTLRKEEERKQMHNKTGGGVFNLIFRRGKTNNGSASLFTTENSISPSHSDDSRSLTPPVAPAQIISPPTTEAQPEKPKAPQRKRRPAPKPPQPVERPPEKEPVEVRISSAMSDNSAASDIAVKNETNLTICHSRHSSDSSGYHETSILSDQCNTSLPRRGRLDEKEMRGKSLNRHSESTGNLAKMALQSRSTSSLAFPGRKKKAAPPPPRPTSSTTNLEKPSPVVASQTLVSSSSSRTDLPFASQGTPKITNPPCAPRRRKGPVPVPRPRSSITSEEQTENRRDSETVADSSLNSSYSCPYHEGEIICQDVVDDNRVSCPNMSTTEILRSLEYLNLDDQGNEIKPPEIIAVLPKSNQEHEDDDSEDDVRLRKRSFKLDLVDRNIDDDNSSIATESPMRDSVSIDSDISNIQYSKKHLRKDFSITSLRSSESRLFEEGGMRRWGSWEKLNQPPTPPSTSPPAEGMETKFPSVKDSHESTESKEKINDATSLLSTDMSPFEEVILKKWGNDTEISDSPSSAKPLDYEDVNNENLSSNQTEVINKDFTEELGCARKLDQLLSHEIKWVIGGDQSDTESISSGAHQSTQIKLESEKIIEHSPKPKDKAKIDQVEDTKNADKKVETEISYNSIPISSITHEINRYMDYEKSPQDSGNSSDISEKSKLDEDLGSEEISGVPQSNNESEEWQLPSPPKAFKDSTPSGQNEQTEMTVTDSVITHQLLEKLKHIEKQQGAQNEESQSDNSSTVSEDRLVLSKLSLENLEKRKSLVYNRELATSLKLSYESSTPQESNLNKRFQSDLNLSKSLNQFEKTLEDIRISNQREEENSRKIKAAASQSTLPNFKITTYDEPKQKIQVFEDDTIRSNCGKSVTLNRAQSLQKTGVGRSMENISDEVFKKPAAQRMFRPKSDHFRRPVNRSGSFSTDQNDWSPSKPVTRSKSQVAIKKEEVSSNLPQHEGLYKSNSLFDVSGLQSLEVMRKIQNKLNTPTTSMETLTKFETEKREESKSHQETPARKYQYTGPPSVNMGTWSDRPKIPVNLKEDADYKLGQRTNINSKVIIRNDSLKNETSEELRHKFDYSNKTENQHVTIKVNGSEPISTQKNGNVLIKIGEQNNRFQDFNTDVLYRQPMSGFNKNSQRPHSVAFPSDFDISRVPVVRSVELKKGFKSTNNTSVTQLNQTNGNYISNGFSDNSKYTNNETLSNKRFVNENLSKPVFRAKSFLQPVVKGFRNFENSVNDNNVINKNSRHSWQSNSSMTLPSNGVKNVAEKQDTYTTNQNVPFSKFNLRKTDSKKIVENRKNDNDIDQKPFSSPSKFQSLKRNETPLQVSRMDHHKKITPEISFERNENSLQISRVDDNYHEKITTETRAPPQPPKMPNIVQKKISHRQFVPVLDPRDELLKSIRDFGGKKGLRGRKA